MHFVYILQPTFSAQDDTVWDHPGQKSNQWPQDVCSDHQATQPNATNPFWHFSLKSLSFLESDFLVQLGLIQKD